MSPRWGILAAAPLLAACASHAAEQAQTHVLALTSTRAAPPCRGWFVMSGDTVTVHLFLAQDARSVDTVANEIDWGDVDLGVRNVAPGARTATLRFSGVTSGVLSLTVHTQGGDQPGSCGIVSPH